MEIPAADYNKDNPSHTSITEGETSVYLRELSEDEIADAPVEKNVKSNEIVTVEIKPALFTNAFVDPSVGSVKIYISVQSTLKHFAGKVETTGITFTNITVKALEMFDLD